jgi:mercuric reductase
MTQHPAYRSVSRHDTGSRIGFQIRPGVFFPDWQAIRSDAVEAALLTVFEAVGIERRWNHYRPDLDRVRAAILQGFVETAHAPSLSELSAATGAAQEEVLSILGELKSRDLVVLDNSGRRVTGAYPFTEHETEHTVRHGERTLRAMCAVDALGVGAMIGTDVIVKSRCRACGTPIHAATADGGRALKSCNPENAVVWVGDHYAGGCGATSLCTMIAFFCSDAHLCSWRDSSAAGVSGHRLSADEAHQLGCAIFGPMLKGTVVEA